MIVWYIRGKGWEEQGLGDIKNTVEIKTATGNLIPDLSYPYYIHTFNTLSYFNRDY